MATEPGDEDEAARAWLDGTWTVFVLQACATLVNRESPAHISEIQRHEWTCLERKIP